MAFDKAHPNEQAWVGKFVIRILSLILITAALIACAVSWKISILILPIIVLSWIWHFTNIVKRLSSEYPMHPGANVACDLLLWLLFLILGSLNMVIAVVARYINGTTWQNNPAIGRMWGYTWTCRDVTREFEEGETYTTQSCTVDGSVIDSINLAGRQSMIGIGFAMIVTLFHLVLWIWACVDTYRYRRDRKMAVEAFRAKQHEFSTEQ